ncbi:MAG: BMP family ABC transporter substrate-binding protein [Synergistaceae bacterium]|nr:BMP family ABC transporter substrate-binding protein [Synergistaceae bacterium]
MKKGLCAFLAGLLVLTIASAGAFAAGDGLKIAIVSSPSDVRDGSFNENNYNGALAFLKAHPDASVTPLVEKTGDVTAALKLVEEVVADYDVLLCCGFQFSGITETAQDNPEARFILVDTWPTDQSGQEVEVENICAMKFREQESGFLAGMAAALCSKTKKVAVVNGIAFPSNVNYQYGFMSGVHYANRRYGAGAEIVELSSYAGTDVTGANVGGNYVGSFSDMVNGKVVGQALIREGCDVIFVAAGGSGNGVFTAAKEAKGVYVIGCDVDQYDDGANGDSNIILTSVLKVMDVNDTRVLNEIAAGTFRGGNYLLGADTDSTGYIKKEGRCQLPEDVVEKLDRVLALLKSGTIVPAAFGSGTKPDGFKGLDAE